MKKISLGLILLGLVAGGCVYKGVEWQVYTPETFDAAMKSGQPTLACFYAAWCPTCYEMKEKTFTDARVIAELMPFQRIRVDMSYKYSPKIQAIGRQFGIQGYPTLIFYDPSGNEIRDLRVAGFLSADELLSIISEIRSRYPAIAPAPAVSPS